MAFTRDRLGGFHDHPSAGHFRSALRFLLCFGTARHNPRVRLGLAPRGLCGRTRLDVEEEEM
jgi:hypothetical protein